MRLFFILMFLTYANFATAEKLGGSFSVQKQGNKQQSRWTIVDYLAQKRKIQLMDMWLAMNTSASLFEFSLGGGPVSYDYTSSTSGTVTTTQHTSQRYSINGYVSIFGLEAEYETTNQKITNSSGAFAIRLLGTSNQSTHLTAKYGLQRRADENVIPSDVWQNQFAEGALQIYVIDFFGIHGNYRYYFPDKSSNGNDLKGTKTTAGAFIEYGIFRIYADAFQEKMIYQSSTNETHRDREGLEYGAQIYF